jgi:hypothetical protein
MLDSGKSFIISNIQQQIFGNILMSIQVDWADETKTVILETFQGNWTWEEFYAISQQAFNMIRSVNHMVHIFSDFRASGSLPVGGAITHAGNVLSDMPANWGLLVIINQNLLINIMVSVFAKTFRTNLGKKTVSVKTM